ncbi:MAG: SCO6880 family protein [Acidimicrobiia bacterium]
MSDAMASAPRYRFAPLDRSGIFMGCNVAQCIALGAAILASALLIRVAPLPIAVAPLLIGTVVAFGRYDGRSLREWIPVLVRWQRTVSRPWCVPVPLLGAGRSGAVPLPPMLDGLELLEVDAPTWVQRRRVGAVGVLLDERARTVTAVLTVAGREFSLAETSEQARAVASWGEVLAVFSRERSPVSRVAWCEWVSPAGVEDHLDFVRSDGAVAAPGRNDYLALVDHARGFTARHEVLVAITVDHRRLRTATRRRAPRGGVSGRDARALAIETVLEETRLFAQRCAEAGLLADAPMTPEAISAAIRTRFDVRANGAGTHSRMWGPMAVTPRFTHVQVDGCWHRSYWIAEWPRLEQPADWMAPLLMHSSGTRGVAMVYEPVATSRSTRAVARDAIKLQTDEDQRRRGGFRVGASQRRAQHEVAQREAELVAGFAELRFAGFLVVSEPSEDALEERCAELEQVAARVGLELRALHGQHDVGLGAALPLGRYPTPQWQP